MLSFMVVSAVGFSVYMRMSRQPSSYLRRASSSRYLLKSALASALERLDGRYTSVDAIDDLAKSTDPDYEEDEDDLYDTDDDGVSATGYMEGICDDPYPGLGPRLQGYSESENLSDTEKKEKSADALKKNGGYFDHRVFTPFGPVDKSKTVSTLTLEGLAYLPPAIINEARVFARRTRTASWRNLAYEAGRYAFAAIDVSDLFDLNRVLPEPRTAGANSRIGFSSLFLKGSRWSDIDTSSGDQHPLGKLVPQGAVDSFLSMADFNLIAWGKDTGATTFSPFGKYVTQGGSVPQIQQNWLDTDAVRNALFITDTWFPDESLKNPDGSESSVTRYTLASDQPFDEYNERWGCEDVLRAANSIPFGKLLRDRLGGVGFIALYDYLDRDNVPTSYALPTVETAPMVCALGLKAGDGIKTRVSRSDTEKRTATVDLSAKNQQIEVVATPYKFTWGVDRLHLYGNVVFPFKRVKSKEANYATKFKAEGLVRVFLAPENLDARLVADSPIIPRAQGDWKKDDSEGILSGKFEMAGDLDFGSDIERPEDAVKPFECDAELEDSPRIVFWEVVKTTYQIDPETGARTPVGNPETYFSLDGVTQSTNPLRTYDGTGKRETWLDDLAKNAQPAMFENGAKLTEGNLPAKAADAGKNIHDGSYVPHVAVWVRVENANGPFSGKTVDVVPAFAADDKVWGLHNESELEEVTIACAGEQPPILRFSGKIDGGFPYGVDAVSKLDSFNGSFGWSKLYVGEPRFNYAPEAWYLVGGEPETVVNDLSGWLQSVSGLLGNNDRDGDIFMFTSDQECLQSMCELQFLPLTRDLAEAPGQVMENFAKFNKAYRYGGSATSVMDFMPGMWQTYSAPDGDPVYNAGDKNVEIMSSRGDFRVNPFTRDRRVLMSVFANTPFDWCVASTNPVCNLSKNAFPDYSFTLNHAFNSKTECAKLTDEVRQDSANASAGDGQAEEAGSDIEELAAGFMEDMRNAVVKNWNGEAKSWPKWETLYDKLDWFGGDERHLFGVELEDGSKPLHDVDRKFLHGFWRECFANRQQLFLVFLRAEPLSVGGGGKEALSCNQLGVHAVALVWRDPKPPYNGADNRAESSAFNGDDPPHRTRILFFHQFD